MKGWTLSAGPPTLTDDPDPAAAFAAMEAEVTGSASKVLLDPVLPCQKTYVELTLTDADGAPLANAAYRLNAPGTAPRSGNLDANGYLRIDDLDLPADQLMLKVWIAEDRDDLEKDLLCELQLVPLEADETVADDAEEATPAPYYFIPKIPLDPMLS